MNTGISAAFKHQNGIELHDLDRPAETGVFHECQIVWHTTAIIAKSIAQSVMEMEGTVILVTKWTFESVQKEISGSGLSPIYQKQSVSWELHFSE